jgi:hypothetical protein
VIHENLVLPNVTALNTALGPSYIILGAYIHGPVNLTATTVNPWEVWVFVSNGSSSAFVNGTTTDLSILRGGGLEIVEDGARAGIPLNSSSAAQGAVGPRVSCVGPGVNPGPANSSCTTQAYSGSNYIVKQNGLSIVVNPQDHALVWTDDRNRLGIEMFGGDQSSIAQMLSLAGFLTLPPAA